MIGQGALLWTAIGVATAGSAVATKYFTMAIAGEEARRSRRHSRTRLAKRLLRIGAAAPDLSRRSLVGSGVSHGSIEDRLMLSMRWQMGLLLLPIHVLPEFPLPHPVMTQVSPMDWQY
jgi:hypothetical protein